jgi:large subunit ribosomal protein L24
MRVRKGDTVLVIAGKEKGRKGRVERLIPSKNRVVVEGLNMVIRHMRPRPDVRQAGRVQKESPIHLSNVMLICNKCEEPSRVRVSFLEDRRKVRVCLRCRETID